MAPHNDLSLSGFRMSDKFEKKSGTVNGATLLYVVILPFYSECRSF